MRKSTNVKIILNSFFAKTLVECIVLYIFSLHENKSNLEITMKKIVEYIYVPQVCTLKWWIFSDYENGIPEYWCVDQENPADLLGNYKGPPGFKKICDGSRDDCVYKGKKKCLESSKCFGIMYHPQRQSTCSKINKKT